MTTRGLHHLEVLSLWERGERLHPLDRGLLVLSQMAPAQSWDALADLPLGSRNRALLEVRVASFGPEFAGWLLCPACGEKLEFTLHADALRRGEPSSTTLEFEGHVFRLPNSRSAAGAAAESDEDRATLRLIEDCSDDPGAVAGLTAAQLDALGERMAEADPLALPTLAFDCAACGHAWEEPLDLVQFLWTELDAEARRLLLDTHQLATAYGWSEAEILALSPRRRAAYLEMVQA